PADFKNKVPCSGTTGYVFSACSAQHRGPFSNAIRPCAERSFSLGAIKMREESAYTWNPMKIM
ncbi:MAG TPA: hypothetical protein VEW69_07825, partial [Alphaproteobacteria bacterium]|nr:hypothetical protein [Alphaproteobacteria bacterium]